ncbi:PRC-barrel domain-containing protein [Chitinimonas lacunae]|uniref:PRC-barrel domain-containing protein n=1 Tax=Chitinimonas lacunae TaxID=1963018 RepID=A0ABV8MMT1_9NEIS
MLQQSSNTGGARIVGSQHSLSSADGPGPYLMLADTLTGNDVVNPAGEKLGDIKGIMLDVQRGRIAYAVLSVGGFLGMGDRLFALPWAALTLDIDQKQFILNASKEVLENAPGFDKDHWPSMADTRWADQVHTYYDVRPYWE